VARCLSESGPFESSGRDPPELKESAMKFFTLISAGGGQNRREFQKWFLKEHAPLVLEHAKGAQRYIVNLADVTPPSVENMTGLAPEVTPAYDVITELWLGSARDFRNPARLYGSGTSADAVQKHLASRARAVYSYRVTEIIEKDLQPIRAGERSPGLKSVIPIEGRPGQSEDDWRNGWRVHSTIALRTHVGMSKYVRNLVEEILTEGAPEYFGIGELHYPTEDDMRYGLFPTPHATEVIAFDIARWGGPVSQHFSSEWPLKV
jgi:hypothetical protein